MVTGLSEKNFRHRRTSRAGRVCGSCRLDGASGEGAASHDRRGAHRAVVGGSNPGPVWDDGTASDAPTARLAESVNRAPHGFEKSNEERF